MIKPEEMQKIFTTMLIEIEGLRYEEGLDSLGIFSLEGDLIEVYGQRIFPGIGKSKTRGHR